MGPAGSLSILVTAESDSTPHKGEAVVLLPQRAVLWPRSQTLLVADLHLGKSAAFRAGGVPIDFNDTSEQLQRLAAAVNAANAQRIVVLGDLLHAPSGVTRSLLDQVAAWRTRFTLPIHLVPGNHDRMVEEAAAAWNMTLREAVVHEPPFVFSHAPIPPVPGRFAWCGHLHPAFVLLSPTGNVKLPAFHLQPARGVLPAFSRFTAGKSLPRGVGDRVFAIADGAVVSATQPTPRHATSAGPALFFRP